MWRDHPSSQRKNATKRAVKVAVGVGQNLKKKGTSSLNRETKEPSVNYDFIHIE